MAADAFPKIVGDPTSLPHIKFVITLDTDTQLPREAARQLAATLAHPLNRPLYDTAKVGGRRLFDFAAAGRRQSAQRKTFAVCEIIFRRSGN